MGNSEKYFVLKLTFHLGGNMSKIIITFLSPYPTGRDEIVCLEWLYFAMERDSYTRWFIVF